MKPYHTVRVLILAAFLLGACAAPDETPIPEATVAGPSTIQVAIASDDFAVGQPRVPIVLYQGLDRVADAQQVRVTAFDLSTDPPTPGWEGEALNYSDYEVPYWVLYPELPHAGNWGLGMQITLANGSTTQGEAVIAALERSSSPPIGSQPPASENRTLETEPDILKLSSGEDPNPSLYQMTVADAMASGKPTVVTFATPRFCTSQLCAPVVDSVESVYEDFDNEANFIHIEIFKDFETLEYADEVEEWGLSSEPWTFVLDGEGVVAARLGGPVSPRELSQSLTEVLQ